MPIASSLKIHDPNSGTGGYSCEMPKAIAFFPWVSISEPLTIGPMRLIPFVRGEAPRDGPKVARMDTDGVFHEAAATDRSD